MYELTKLLGKGAYTTVYKSKDSNDSVIALKIIKVPLKKCGVETWILRELELLTTIKHKNIAETKKITIDKNIIYVEMEFVKLSLERIKSSLEMEHVIRYTYQLLSVINFLHSNNIAHRDIKPENILIDDDNIKLIDFNLSKKLIGKQQSPRVATLHYRAPEIISNIDYDPIQCDMWSIGCILLEMLSGKTLFPDMTDKKVQRNQNIILSQRKGSNSTYWNKFVRPEFLSDENCKYLIDIVDCLIVPKNRMNTSEILNFPIFQNLHVEDNPIEVSLIIQVQEKTLNMTEDNINKIKTLIRNICCEYDRDDCCCYTENIVFRYLRNVELVPDINIVIMVCVSLIMKVIYGQYISIKKLSKDKLIELEIDILKNINYTLTM